MIFSFHPAAEGEYFEAANFYKNHSVKVSESFIFEIEKGIQQILDNPLAWAEVEPGIRRYLVRRFSFAIYYRIKEERIQIMAVVHFNKRPVSYKNRIGDK